MSESSPAYEPISRKFVSQRLRLHYVEWVNENAPLLIMVHGGQDHCRSWDWIARELHPRYNIVAPDLRGHGDSSWTKSVYRKLDFVYDLKKLISLKGNSKVTIIAHSFGSWVSLLYAGLHPDMVEKLVVVEGLLPVDPDHRVRLNNPRHKRIKDWMDVVSNASRFYPKRMPSFEAALSRLQSVNSYLSDEQARHLTTHAVNQNEDGTYSWKYDNYLRSMDDSPELLESEVIDIRKRIKCPILLLQGEDSPFYMEEDNKYITSLPNCEVLNFKDAGHWLHHDQLDRFLKVVGDFL